MQKILSNIGAIIGQTAVDFAVGVAVYVAWNGIAYECNLPQFSYWVCTCAWIAIRHLLMVIKRKGE